MEYIYAALLLHRLGKEVSEGSVKKVVEAAGVKADEMRVKALVTVLAEVNIEEALKSAAAASFAPQPAVQAASAAPAKEEKVEEEKKEEEALAGLSSLFG